MLTDPELAVDGIDEFLTVFLPRLAGRLTAIDGHVRAPALHRHRRGVAVRA